MPGHTAPPPERRSDRWITPGVIIAGLIVAGLVTMTVAAGVTYLTARGIDPDPMLRLVAQVTTAVGSIGTLVLQLVGRSTVAKTERNTGVLAENVAAALSTPAPAPALPAYVDDEDLADEEPREYYGRLRQSAPPEETGEYPRVSVPPIPGYPQYRDRSAR